MRIERHYYTASKREFDEAEAEVRKEREAMTEEERQAEKQENSIGWKKLMDRMELERRRCKKVSNPEKTEYFKELSIIGLELAGKIDADIVVESNEEHGSIKMVTGLILFGEPTRNAGKEELLLLLRMADDVLIRPKVEAFELDLRFDLFDEMVI